MRSPNPPGVDEVFRRMGRNLFLFQQIELLLKHLLGIARLEGPVASMQDQLAARRDTLKKATLGSLVGRFSNECMTGAESQKVAETVPQVIKEVWVSQRFGLQLEGADKDALQAELAAVVNSRNELVHQFLPLWSPDSEDSTVRALDYLDNQRAAAVPILERLRGMAEAHDRAIQEWAGFMTSPEGQRQLRRQLLCDSYLVNRLSQIEGAQGGPDGWTDLAEAESLLRLADADELAQMATRHGHESLLALIRATELFDIQEQALPDGGVRTVYRTRPSHA